MDEKVFLPTGCPSRQPTRSLPARGGRARDKHALARLGVVPAVAVATLGIAGGAVGAAASPAAAGKSELVVKIVTNAKLGHVLEDTAGFTLYRYTLDKPGKVACTGGCATYWPPLVLKGGATTPTGKGVSDLGTVKDPDGKLQVTYKGHPLYTFAGDSKPGTTKGQGVDKTWYVCTTSVAAMAASSSSSGGSSGSGGYGY